MNKKHHNIYYAVVCILIGLSLFFIHRNFFADKNLKVIFLDVGQGDAILIQTPNGRTVLIDGGKYNGLGTSLSRHLPISDRGIDIMIATHPDMDHAGGLNSIADEYQVDMFIHSGVMDDSNFYRNLLQKISSSDTHIVTATAGSRIVVDKNVYIDILSPYPGMDFESNNEHSVVTRIIYNDISFLLTGDAGIFNEQDLINVYGKGILESNVLKAGHHGSKTSTSESFVEIVQPQYGVISAGCDNSYGHPHQSVLDTLFHHGIEILSTCDLGDIIFKTDGENLVLNP